MSLLGGRKIRSTFRMTVGVVQELKPTYALAYVAVVAGG